MQMINVITIDGPSASGKGALARNIAHQFGLNILDSGVLYRLFAYFDILNVSYEEIASKIDNEINFKLEKDILKILFQDKDISFELP